MKTNTFSKLLSCKDWLTSLFIALSFCATANAATTIVNCTGSNDTNAIQSAINTAKAKDIIQLTGVCQLTGTSIKIKTSNITIQGAGEKGNWSTILSGCIDNNTPNGNCSPSATGLPLGNNPTTSQLRNNGFEFGPTSGTISNVTIQGIKFQNLNTGVRIIPSVDGNTRACSGMIVTNGTALSINVKKNWFNNIRTGVFNAGLSEYINIASNLFTNSGYDGADIISRGSIISCDGGGPGTAYPDGFHKLSGSPESVYIDVNKITNGHAIFPIDAFSDISYLEMSGNIVMGNSNTRVNILFSGNPAVITSNIVDGAGVAYAGIYSSQVFALDNTNKIFLSPIASMKNSISNNTISNVQLTGIGLDSAISGTSVSSNQFDSSGLVNIFLCDATSDTNDLANNLCDGGDFPGPGGSQVAASNNNKVSTGNSGNTIMDLGFKNRLIGTYNLLTNVTVPTNEKLIQKGRPPLE